MLGDRQMFRLAAQDINRASLRFPVVSFVRKQRARLRIGDPSASLVFIELTLQRAHQHAAFCAVVENHPQPGIGPSLGACEDLPSHG